jgi:hypothetical protein
METIKLLLREIEKICRIITAQGHKTMALRAVSNRTWTFSHFLSRPLLNSEDSANPAEFKSFLHSWNLYVFFQNFNIQGQYFALAPTHQQ